MSQPASAVPRLAFIVLAHHQTKQLARLLRRLNKAGWPIYLHLDRKMREIPYSETVVEVSRLPHVDLLRRHRCHWGGWGIVRATLAGLNAALSAPEPFDHLFLLSGQCYPIKTDRELLAFSEANRGKSWVQTYPVPSGHAWQTENGGLDRFARRHYPDVPTALARRLFRVAARRGYTPALSTPPNLPLFGGSQFWGLSHEAAQYVQDFCSNRPEVVRFFRHAAIPDEHFFQTILGGSPLANDGKIHCQTPHHLLWDEGTSRPSVLTLDHLPELLASERVFARKFDEKISVELREALDARNKVSRA